MSGLPRLSWRPFDPAERLAENFDNCEALPEDLARELRTCYNTHRENRQRLAKAVQARGYYVGGKSTGKSGKSKSKGKGKGGGKKGGPSGKGGRARGMSLDELKAMTACAQCGQRGHWKGDAACPGAKTVHAAGRHDEEEAEASYDQDDGWYDQAAEQEDWEAWSSARYGFAAQRVENDASKNRVDPLYSEAAVSRGINRVLNKAGIQPRKDVETVQNTIRSDD